MNMLTSGGVQTTKTIHENTISISIETAMQEDCQNILGPLAQECTNQCLNTSGTTSPTHFPKQYQFFAFHFQQYCVWRLLVPDRLPLPQSAVSFNLISPLVFSGLTSSLSNQLPVPIASCCCRLFWLTLPHAFL